MQEIYMKKFLEQNPDYKNIEDASKDTRELLLWADCKHILLVHIYDNVFYCQQDLECAYMWKEKEKNENK